MIAWLSTDMGVTPTMFKRVMSIRELHQMASAKYLQVYSWALIAGEMLGGAKGKGKGSAKAGSRSRDEFIRAVEAQRKGMGRTKGVDLHDLDTPAGEAVLLKSLPFDEKSGGAPRAIDRLRKQRSVRAF